MGCDAGLFGLLALKNEKKLPSFFGPEELRTSTIFVLLIRRTTNPQFSCIVPKERRIRPSSFQKNYPSPIFVLRSRRLSRRSSSAQGWTIGNTLREQMYSDLENDIFDHQILRIENICYLLLHTEALIEDRCRSCDEPGKAGRSGATTRQDGAHIFGRPENYCYVTISKMEIIMLDICSKIIKADTPVRYYFLNEHRMQKRS